MTTEGFPTVRAFRIGGLTRHAADGAGAIESAAADACRLDGQRSVTEV
jgi:hypothetical protein